MKRNQIILSVIRLLLAVLIVLLVAIAAVRISTVCYDFGFRVFTETAVDEAPGTDKIVQVKEGMSSQEIAELLEEKGLIRDHNLFLLQLYLSVYKNGLKPGVYTLNTSMTPKEIMAVMSAEEVTESTEDSESIIPDAEDSVMATETEEAIPSGE